MTRILTIIALLFATPAWAGDDVIHLDCTYGDGSKGVWRLKPKAKLLEQGYDQYECEELPDFYRCENRFGAIGEINRYNLDFWWQSGDGDFTLNAKCKSVEPKF
jgi:hypothetical protein